MARNRNKHPGNNFWKGTCRCGASITKRNSISISVPDSKGVVKREGGRLPRICNACAEKMAASTPAA